MSNHGQLLGLIVQNFRNTGDLSIASVKEVIQSLADTNMSQQEIGQAFQQHLIESASFTEVEQSNAESVV